MEPTALVPTPPAPRPKSTLGSLAIAMLVGVLVTITVLYVWGSQIAAEQASQMTE